VDPPIWMRNAQPLPTITNEKNVPTASWSKCRSSVSEGSAGKLLPIFVCVRVPFAVEFVSQTDFPISKVYIEINDIVDSIITKCRRDHIEAFKFRMGSTEGDFSVTAAQMISTAVDPPIWMRNAQPLPTITNEKNVPTASWRRCRSRISILPILGFGVTGRSVQNLTPTVTDLKLSVPPQCDGSQPTGIIVTRTSADHSDKARIGGRRRSPQA
jgi:hypothetical protein